MLGRNEGWVTTQGEVLADLLRADGWDVRETSTQPSRVLRLVDTVVCLLRWRRSIDIVVLSVFSGPAFVMADVSSAVARFLRIPIVAVLHGGNLPVHVHRHPRWSRRVLSRARRIVAPSGYLATDDLLLGRSPVLIPNVVDLSGIEYRERSRVRGQILWMRTFHPIYNPSLAVRALCLLHDDHPDIRMTMAGQEKGLTDAVRDEVASSGLTDVVTFAGFLGRDEKRDEFNRHDVFLNTNRVDNTPVSVIEAAAAGLPIVATEVGGIPHLLTHEHDALLVPDDDEDAVTEAIGRLIDDADLAARLSRNGRRLAEQSSWPVVRERWTDLFMEVDRSH